jgi:hypothetical protein
VRPVEVVVVGALVALGAVPRPVSAQELTTLPPVRGTG